MKEGGKGEPVGTSKSYDPYLVYIQKRAGDRIDFKLDEQLSAEYSKKNGYGWHGSNYDEKIQIDDKGNVVK